ncbi:hypothetical protein lerEdw1_016512 [Lerista edwardsae]|nr:hypothetical protein lerEdw1_016512 [Lerista edwardsae]
MVRGSDCAGSGQFLLFVGASWQPSFCTPAYFLFPLLGGLWIEWQGLHPRLISYELRKDGSSRTLEAAGVLWKTHQPRNTRRKNSCCWYP